MSTPQAKPCLFSKKAKLTQGFCFPRGKNVQEEMTAQEHRARRFPPLFEDGLSALPQPFSAFFFRARLEVSKDGKQRNNFQGWAGSPQVNMGSAAVLLFLTQIPQLSQDHTFPWLL